MSAAPSTDRPAIRLELTSDPRYLSGARELVAAVAERLGFSDEACGHLKLAVDEALCNVIRHGYDRRSDGPMWLSMWPIGSASSPTGIRIQIDDEARQVEPAQIKSRNLDDIRPGGLGVHIIYQLMDEVRYEKRESVGMRLTMVKMKQAHRAEGGPTEP